MTEEMLTPRRRGRPRKVKEEPVQTPPAVVLMEEPPVLIDDPNMVDEFARIFDRDELTPEALADLDKYRAENPVEDDPEMDVELGEEVFAKPSTKPTRSKFITMGNGLYLPVRQRIVWMRGEPEPHPDWLIQTEMIRFLEGTYIAKKSVYLGGVLQDVPDVQGGLAVVQARVLVRMPDGSEGPVIGEGTAMERSELFHDFVEKAETAAIGRALAVAGYGTEAALDLDEGDGNIADAPVRTNIIPTVPPAAINITSSGIPDVRQGGRQVRATEAQIAAIREKCRDLMLPPKELQNIVFGAMGEDHKGDKFFLTDVGDGPDGANDVMGYIADLDFESCGKVVLALTDRAQQG